MKKLLFRTIIVSVFLWPFLHHWIMPYYNIDVWKYFGMAMYAHTVSRIHTSIEAEFEDKSHKRLPPRYQKHFNHFNNTLVMRHRYLGDLHDFTDTASVLFEATPSLVAVRVILRDINLAETSMTYERRVVHTCQRLAETSQVQCTRTIHDPFVLSSSPR